MTEEQLSALERECLSHLLSYLRGLTNAREFWYLVALEQEHAASREALQMMEHVEKQPKAAASKPSFDPSPASISDEEAAAELFDDIWNAIRSSQTSDEAWGKIGELRAADKASEVQP